MNYPSIDNPFMIKVHNYMHPYSIPGLKNSQQLGVTKNCEPYTSHNSRLTAFLKEFRPKIAEAYQNSDFDTIPKPQRVLVWGFFTVYSTDNGISLPKLDLDNQWQTLQEIMAPKIVDNDKQIESVTMQRVYTKIKEAQVACLWLWKMEDDLFAFEQQQELYRIHYNWIWSLINKEIHAEKHIPQQLSDLLKGL